MRWLPMLRAGLLLGSVITAAACEDPKPEPVCELTRGVEQLGRDEKLDPYNKPLSLNGQGGTNGLDSDAFQKYFDELRELTKIALSDGAGAVDGIHTLNPAISDGFLSDVEDHKIRSLIFDKVVQCALPRDTTGKPGIKLRDSKSNTIYKGGGLLSTTAGWVDKQLEQNPQDDLFTCLILLINPNYKGIPVFLAGEAVSVDDEIPAKDYPFEEALWSAGLDPNGRIVLNVWPLFEGAQFPDDCSANITDPWKFRVCGSNTDECDLLVREDLDRCKKIPEGVETEHYECPISPSESAPLEMRSVIKTRLKNVCDLNALFCPIPQ